MPRVVRKGRQSSSSRKSKEPQQVVGRFAAAPTSLSVRSQMSFAQLVGHEHNRQILQRLLRQGRVGASLIFAGPEGVGKRQFALTFAKAANCRSSSRDERAFHEESCDSCPSCSRIEARVSSDVAVVVPDGAYIKIAQTRALSNEIQYRPREGRQRFFLIDAADRLRRRPRTHSSRLWRSLRRPRQSSC